MHYQKRNKWKRRERAQRISNVPVEWETLAVIHCERKVITVWHILFGEQINFRSLIRTDAMIKKIKIFPRAVESQEIERFEFIFIIKWIIGVVFFAEGDFFVMKNLKYSAIDFYRDEKLIFVRCWDEKYF